jgi:hypothetical protein
MPFLIDVEFMQWRTIQTVLAPIKARVLRMSDNFKVLQTQPSTDSGMSLNLVKPPLLFERCQFLISK